MYFDGLAGRRCFCPTPSRQRHRGTPRFWLRRDTYPDTRRLTIPAGVAADMARRRPPLHSTFAAQYVRYRDGGRLTTSDQRREHAMGKLDGKKIAVLFTDGVEQVELDQPVEGFENEGAEVTYLTLETGE